MAVCLTVATQVVCFGKRTKAASGGASVVHAPCATVISTSDGSHGSGACPEARRAAVQARRPSSPDLAWARFGSVSTPWQILVLLRGSRTVTHADCGLVAALQCHHSQNESLKRAPGCLQGYRTVTQADCGLVAALQCHHSQNEALKRAPGCRLLAPTRSPLALHSMTALSPPKRIPRPQKWNRCDEGQWRWQQHAALRPTQKALRRLPSEEASEEALRAPSHARTRSFSAPPAARAAHFRSQGPREAISDFTAEARVWRPQREEATRRSPSFAPKRPRVRSLRRRRRPTAHQAASTRRVRHWHTTARAARAQFQRWRPAGGAGPFAAGAPARARTHRTPPGRRAPRATTS